MERKGNGENRRLLD